MLLAGWFLVLSPLIDLALERNADIVTMSDRLAHLRAIAARGTTFQKREQALQAELAAEGGFWQGASSAVVAASVQDQLRHVVTDSGGVVRSTSELRGGTEREARTVRVRFRIAGTLETVQKTLDSIQTMRPALFVDAFSIIGSDGPIDQAKPPMLDLDLEVSAYMPMART